MIELPDNLQRYLKPVIKYHFWWLAILMPLVLVPLAFTADARLIGQISKQRQEVETKLESVERLARAGANGLDEFGHPQPEWANQIESTTEQRRKQVLQQWRAFWDKQQGLRVWPEELRLDFIDRIKRLEPGDSLTPRFVERYQNTIRRVVRKLPARLDAAEEMLAADGAPGSGVGRRFNPVTEPGQFGDGLDSNDIVRHTVTWNPTDQSALYAGFNWQKPPSTTQILVAQEELWAYEALCDAIAASNAGATGSHNATIATIDQLAVGYRAAQSAASGQGGGRVERLQTTTSGEMGMGMDTGMGMDMGMDGATAGPLPNPRFSGGNQPMGMTMGGEFPGDDFGISDESGDDALRNWIYVDASGTPLPAEEIESSPDTKLAHLVPFVVRGRVDQRKLDLLLRTLATWSVPIDVRQVRINPNSSSGMAGMDQPIMAGRMMGNPLSGPGDRNPNGTSVRRYDLTVELRGMIALATRPNPEFLGLTDVADDSASLPPGE